MVSLVDIVPQTRTVQITGGDVTLRGLGLRQIAGLLLSFPSLYSFFILRDASIEPDALLVAAPDAIGAIIAEAAGQPDAAEAVADRLPVDDVIACLTAVRDLTMPNGASPFRAALAALLGGAGPAGTESDTTLQPVPNGLSQQDIASSM